MVLTTPSGDADSKRSITFDTISGEIVKPSLKTLIFSFDVTLAVVKMCRKGEVVPKNQDFKFAVPLGNKEIKY
jgi:hypothetical protein